MLWGKAKERRGGHLPPLDSTQKSPSYFSIKQIVGTGFWALLLLGKGTQAQLAQYNKFVENKFKN